MTRRLFVCHASAEIESASELVDLLENALDFPSGALLTSSLPGYSPDTQKEDALRDALGETTIVLALVSENSVGDPVFNFELGAAWALGIRSVAILLGDPSELALPWPLASLPAVRGQDASDWTSLIGDLSLRLGLVPRPSASKPALLRAHVGRARAPQPSAASALPPPAASIALSQDWAPEEAPQTWPIDSTAQPWADATPQPSAAEEETSPRPWAAASSSARPDYRAELPTPTFDSPALSDASDYTPARTNGGAAPSQPPASDVYSRPPTCELCLEAGRAVSDCLFNRDEISDFESELAKPLGRLVDSLGGSWDELRVTQDFDGWRHTTEALLRTLPSEARRVEDWYQLGFELAILHNLAGQLVLDGSDAAAEQQWRGTLERFLERAERAGIGYENLGRVLALLENLAGPSAERDLANIGRSLEELRRYAAGADGIHSAA